VVLELRALYHGVFGENDDEVEIGVKYGRYRGGMGVRFFLTDFYIRRETIRRK